MCLLVNIYVVQVILQKFVQPYTPNSIGEMYSTQSLDNSVYGIVVHECSITVLLRHSAKFQKDCCV